MTAFDYAGFFDWQLAQLHREGRYRRFRHLQRGARPFPWATWLPETGAPRDIVVWCSKDYLGMSQHPCVREAAAEALARYGSGAGGTRAISGTHEPLVQLEAELAAWHRKSAALVFSSGYVANDTTLATLGRRLPGCTIYSDAHNHASMIEGIRRSGATCEIFAHNDPQHLQSLLARSDPSRPRIVAFESLYSMDGDIAPLADLVAVARAHGALTYVDETHAVGVHGPEGAGLVAAAGLLDQVDIIQGGLGKAVGAVGGFITASAGIIDFVRSFAPGFIFTTALPPAVAAAALASVRHLRSSETERLRLWNRVAAVRAVLEQVGLRPLNDAAQILPLLVGDARRCERLAERLLTEFGIYLQPINYPTVPKHTERLRITPTALHTDDMLASLRIALAACLPQLLMAPAA
ncbi:MAG: 5-aminolevulinate synthase [Gammaproteobacteria bacterium]|nr:5-aminolevulinate synthase [Gammaproteobacteria bacterium]